MNILNKNRQQVLDFFLKKPKKLSYAYKISKELKMHKGTAKNTLDWLRLNGMLFSEETERRTTFWLNTDSDFVKMIKETTKKQ